MNKIVIWFLGSNGTGKTTQTKNILNMVGEPEKIEIVQGYEEEVEYRYTKFGSMIAALGTVSDRDCCGCDTLKNKASIRLSYLKAIEDCQIVLIDGIMSTGTWIEFIREKDVKLLVVHFKIELENNLLRVLGRRGKEIHEVDDENLERLAGNLQGKIKGFHNQYLRQSQNADKNLEVCALKEKDHITEVLIESIEELL